tara:strand:- start:26 stop:271 length:246 start_codon:yes stop_codon:yes gene_type:complete
MNYQDLIKFSSSNVSLDSLIRNNNLVNYTTQEREKEKTSEDDEIKEILKIVKKEKEFKQKPSLIKIQSYCSIQDELIFLRL